MTTPSAELKMITLDCLDPKAAADFRAQLLGWDLAHSEDAHAMVTGPHAALGFGRVEDCEPPAWPNPRGNKQLHAGRQLG
ncbi:MAG: hypothetical protein H0T66_01720 [Geodermatophilaceae bacterium]|nr:hypothetical protein [Geodermatophilaceae bacterium]MDQ3457676.1 hypothetical protein [Actinomycetota bacterium]